MKKLLIVEDELLERNALRSITKSKFAGVLEVFDTDNGEEALNLALTHRPDLILMDIHLGSSNGIELSRMILEDSCLSRIIILTAFDQFAYAQSAIKIGIKDFLLKPINTNELIGAIQKQLDEIKRAEAELKAMGASAEIIGTIRPYLARQLFMMVTENNYAAEDLNSLLQALGLHFMSCCILTIMFAEGVDYTYTQSLAIKQKISELLPQCTADADMVIDFQSEKHISAIVFFKESKGAFETRINSIEIAKAIRNIVADRISCEIRIGISEPVESMSLLANAYRNSLFALINGRDPINSFPDMEYSETIPTYPRRTEEVMLKSLFNPGDSRLESCFEDYTSELSAADGKLSTKSVMLQFLSRLHKEVGDRFGDSLSNSEKLIEQSISDVARSESNRNIIANVRNLLMALKETMTEKQNNKNKYMIERTEKYINENFNTAFTLDNIAQKMRISPYYLCRTFKEVAGINLLDYITGIRIEKSKDYLKNSEDPIKEISINVGFSDPNYFCKVFKKSTGMTPSEFRSITNQR